MGRVREDKGRFLKALDVMMQIFRDSSIGILIIA